MFLFQVPVKSSSKPHFLGTKPAEIELLLVKNLNMVFQVFPGFKDFGAFVAMKHIPMCFRMFMQGLPVSVGSSASRTLKLLLVVIGILQGQSEITNQ